MLRIVTSEEMQQIEKRAESSGLTQEMLMEEAGKQIEAFIVDFVTSHSLAKKAYILAGKGNNGGDAYVVARRLLQQGFTVQALQVLPLEPTSLCRKQRRRFEARGGKVVELVNDLVHDLPSLPKEGVLIDGIFGTGCRGAIEPKIAAVIEAANLSKLPIIAIDIPSGLNASTGKIETISCRTTCTLALEFPKIGYFLEDGYNVVGKISILPIGLAPHAQETDIRIQLLQESDVECLLPTIVRNRHKYSAGHVVGFAGSHGMAGASLLASQGAMRSGAGIVHLLYPEEHSYEFMGPPLEIVRVPYQRQEIDIIRKWISQGSSCFVGPGLGPQKEMLNTLWSQLHEQKAVIDADALNWLAERSDQYLLPQAILTPHRGEMQRLLKKEKAASLNQEFLLACQEFAATHNTQLLLKGAPTFLFVKDRPPAVLTWGDPGMATAGSGDVLTGILAALLAQKLTPENAMYLGAFLHAKAGELAAQEETSFGMIASSIINKLPAAFQYLLRRSPIWQ